MKSILISIRPKWVAKILNGEKTIEIRKTMPKCDLPIDVYIYCTKQNAKYYIQNKIYNSMMNGKVVAKFTLKKVEEISYFDVFTVPDGYENYDGEWIDTSKEYKNVHYINSKTLQKTCLSYEELQKYLGNKNGYAWHIDNLEICDKPKELSEFKCLAKGNKLDHSIDAINYVGGLPLTKAPQSWQFVESEK